MSEHSNRRPVSESTSPLTDSPWFWLYLFTTFGLIVAIGMGPKLLARQRELDLEAAAKRQALSESSLKSSDRSASEQGEKSKQSEQKALAAQPVYRFYTLLIILGLLTAGGWTGLWWSRLRRSRNSRPTNVAPREGNG